MLRLLVGLALGFGFIGFATHSHAEPGALIRMPSESERDRLNTPEWVPDELADAAITMGIPHAGIGAAPPIVWREGKGLVTVLRPGVRYRRGVAFVSIAGSF